MHGVRGVYVGMRVCGVCSVVSGVCVGMRVGGGIHGVSGGCGCTSMRVSGGV